MTGGWAYWYSVPPRRLCWHVSPVGDCHQIRSTAGRIEQLSPNPQSSCLWRLEAVLGCAPSYTDDSGNGVREHSLMRASSSLIFLYVLAFIFF